MLEPEGFDVSKISTDLAATPLPRSALAAAITRERQRWPWEKSTADELVIKLVRGYDATTFLMDWYCKYSRTNMPYLYSPTWNLQCKAAIDTLKDIQKGLKLHNAFIHWRHAGDEVWCGILYFVIALMDKWAALLSGGSLVGLSDADSATFRLAVGFSLAYYLVAAVCLDSVAYPLWAMANKRTDQPITSLQFLQDAAVNDARARRKLYWGNFFKFLFMHFWGLCVAAALMWTFEESRSAIIMFMGYVGAYTGLLWYQYNRVYTGPRALKDLVTAAIAGIVTGPILFRVLPQFQFSGVVALGIATWTSAILSLRTAKVGRPKSKDARKEAIVLEAQATYFGNAHRAHHTPSRRDLSAMFNTLCSLEQEYRYRVDPKTYPGLESMTLLRARETLGSPNVVRSTLLSVDCVISRTIALWEKGDIIVDMVSATPTLPQSNKMRSISRFFDNQLHILVFIRHDVERDTFRRNGMIIAELLIQATAEIIYDLPHDQSILYELLLIDHDDEKAAPIPEGIKSQLEYSPSDRARVSKNHNRELLHHIMLGIDCDRDWDRLPKTVRSFLLRRCCGEACTLTTEQSDCILSRLGIEESFSLETYIAQCDLRATLARSIHGFANSIDAKYDIHDQTRLLDSDCHMVSENAHLLATTYPAVQGNLLGRLSSEILNHLRFIIKLFVIAFVADPEYQRELDYTISRRWCFIRWPVKIILNGIWVYCKTLQSIVIPWFLFHRREKMKSLRTSMRGTKTILEKHRIIIEGLDGPSTGFFKTQSNGCRQLRQYNGKHDKEPNDDQQLMAINTYTDKLVLRRREEFTNHVNHYEYEYPLGGPDPGSKVPILRRCLKGDSLGQEVQYNKDGHITSGSYLQAENLVKFKFWYRKHAKFHDELLRAEFVLPHITMRVSWCVPPRKNPDQKDTWIPYTKVTEATFIQRSEVFHSVWSYDHKSHPVITTTLHGRSVAAPSMIAHDWFGILRKPTDCTFLSDNLLFSFKSTNTSLVSRLLGLNKRYYPISTARARTHLWKSWKSGKDLDAVTVRWLDEAALRHDRVLGSYWLARDIGQLKAAEGYLDLHSVAIMARADIDPEVSSWSSLAFKLSDLYTFGQGGDARINTRKMTTQMKDSDEALHVLAMDTGTWPNEGGGVSACRRDMVNDLKTIRWHVLAEMANDFGTPKFQIEKNVQSLTILPLWGLDFLTPTHGVFQNYLDSEVQQKSFDTSEADIVLNFMPILVTLVRCSRAIKIEHHHIEEATKALVDLNTYFESSRHWTKVWTSDVVKEKWRELWLTEEMDNAQPVSEWLDAEKPTLLHMDNALDMWHRYLFIFSVPVPETIPDVFQASHHFAGSSYGVLCKIKRNCTLHIWDHCISWREVTVFLSSAMSFDSPFVCTSLISLSRLTSTLVLHYADVVLPCADFFNPGWEIEIGICEGVLQHRRRYARKIDPVVNGICNMENFQPIEKIKSKVPTVIMLSHVRFVKDIKNALLAADIIVNEWGFTDYQLDIYGDMEKAPAYSVECKEILASKGLRDHVALRGLGSPSKVLEEAWIFLNSSISEGLPLAMGEAALTGVPVVCTDVGASFRVVTDPVTWKKFSAVVAPNDAHSLARAQINVLGLLDEWSEYADDEPGYRPKMTHSPTREEVTMITKRMYEKSAQRRTLGMMGRKNVLKSFSSERYLREHEQMLWIGKDQSPSYLAKASRTTSTVFSTEQ